MLNTTSKRSLRSVLLAGTAAVAALALSSVPSIAQDGDQKVEKVTVTGSRIKRTEYSAESPVTILDAKEIAQSGKLNLGEVLRTQVGVGRGGSNQSSVLSGGGAFTVDIRDLGTDRALTLINGRRLANFADGLQNEFKDLAFVPLAMIERVEILRDGASSTYGADAVSGVLNVILKDDFEGLEVTGQAGISDRHDAETFALQAVFGANFDRGNVVFSAGYTSSGLVPQHDRSDWALPSIAALGAGSVVNGSGAHPGGTIFFNNGGAAIDWCTKPIALGGDEFTNVAGTANCPSQAPSNPNDLIGRYDYALRQSIIGSSEVVNLAGFATFDIEKDLHAFMEAQVSNRVGDTVLDGNPIFEGSGSPSFPLGWVIPTNNTHRAMLPANGGPNTHFVRIRPSSTVGTREQTVDANMFRTVAGLKGEGLMGMFDWEVAYLWTKVTSSLTTDSTFNLARANRISDTAACAADPICAAALAPANFSLNVYQPSTWSASEIAYFRQKATTNSDFSMRGVSATMVGEIFELPAGSVGLAAGFEYRDESVDFKPDAVTEAGESVANQTFSTNGSFDTYEFFAELDIPLVKDQMLFKDLTLNLQARKFDYSSFGTDLVYKAGMNWQVVDDLRLRGTYGTSFRAPTLVDSFSGGTVSFDFIDDPCDAFNVPELLDPVRAANCAAGLGILFPGFTQTAPQLAVLAGGDIVDGTLDLSPETSEAWTLGAIITPSFLPGFSASVDLWNIAIDNQISSVDTEGEVLDVCYDSVALSAPECGLFSRNPVTGQLSGLTRFPLNRPGVTENSGIDWAVTYGFDVGSGRVQLDHSGTKYDALPGFPAEGECAGSSGTCIPEYRLNFAAEYTAADWSLGWRGNYTPFIPVIDRTQPNFLNYTGAESMFNHDVHGSWNFANNFALLGGVNNLLDDQPPYVFNTGNNTDTGLYGTQVVGRYYWLRVAAKY